MREPKKKKAARKPRPCVYVVELFAWRSYRIGGKTIIAKVKLDESDEMWANSKAAAIREYKEEIGWHGRRLSTLFRNSKPVKGKRPVFIARPVSTETDHWHDFGPKVRL